MSVVGSLRLVVWKFLLELHHWCGHLGGRGGRSLLGRAQSGVDFGRHTFATGTTWSSLADYDSSIGDLTLQLSGMVPTVVVVLCAHRSSTACCTIGGVHCRSLLIAAHTGRLRSTATATGRLALMCQTLSALGNVSSILSVDIRGGAGGGAAARFRRLSTAIAAGSGTGLTTRA